MGFKAEEEGIAVAIPTDENAKPRQYSAFRRVRICRVCLGRACNRPRGMLECVCGFAEVMELADVTDSKSVVGDNVWVRVPPSAPM